jgi:hypothetical protein
VVSFTPRGKSPRNPLDKKLGGPQSRSRRCGVRKDLLPLPETEPRPSVAIRIELSRLQRNSQWETKSRYTLQLPVHRTSSVGLPYTRLVRSRSDTIHDTKYAIRNFMYLRKKCTRLPGSRFIIVPRLGTSGPVSRYV